ncbi:adhesin, partial [Ignatzschineria ureiclastica]
DGKDGVDGKIGVTGKDGSSVVINGEDGSIGLTGPKGEAGKDAPTLNIAVKDGAPGLNGKDGEVRIVYKDKDGNEKEVASLDDGLLFGADNDGVVVERKLNQKLDILGGANNATDAKNIVTTANADGSIQIDLAKDLDLGTTGSVKTGNTTVNNNGVKVGDNVTLGDTGLTIKDGPSITANGVDAGGKTITNVADGVNGKDAVNKDQLDGLKTSVEGSLDKGLNFAGNTAGTVINKKLGDTVTIKGGLADNVDASDENLRVDVENGNLVVKMAKNLSGLGDIQVGEAGKDGKDGVDGKIGVTGKDGSSVVINGEDGSIGLTGPKGEAGKDAPTLNIAVKDGAPGLNGKDGEVRIVYKDKDGNEKEVASLDDGLLFGADNDGVVVERKLNQKLDILGGANNATDAKNIVTTANADGSIQIDLAKDLDLGTTGSVKTGNTTVNNDGVKVGDNVTLGDTGLTIKDGPSITANGVDAGGKTITNVADGVNGKDAVNKDQLDGLKASVEGSLDKGLNFAGNTAGTVINKKLGDTVTIKGGLANNVDASDENLRVDVEDGNLVVKMAKNLSGLGDIQVGEAGKDGKDGVDGKIGVTGKDGSSVVINGEDGSIGLTGPKGEAGKDAPTLNIAVKDGAPGLNGKDGEVRIVYKDKDGNEKEVASLDDGLLFGADNDGV